MNTPDQVYTLLRDALLKARADGKRIFSNVFGDCETSCCAVTAFTMKPTHMGEAADMLRISKDNLWDVVGGFDAGKYMPETPFYAIGQKLRAEFIEQKGEA